jgi:PAS domain S-box-containing protein
MEKNRNSGIALNIMYVQWGGASLSTLLVIMLVAFALKSIDSSHQNSIRVDHSYQTIVGIHRIKHQMVALEVDLRGFLITGQEDFLGHFQENKVNIFKDIADLKTTIRDNPQQVFTLASIEREIHIWLDTTGSTGIDARRKFDRGETTFDTVERQLNNDSVKQQNKTVMEMFFRFLSVEEIAKVQRRQQTFFEWESTQIILIIAVVLIIFVKVLVTWVTSRFILDNDWVKSHHSIIVKNLQDATTLETFSDVLLSTLMPLLTAQTATLYSIHTDANTDIDSDSDNHEIYRIGAYGSLALSKEPVAFEKGRGLVGQCFTDRKEIKVTDVPPAYFDIVSSLGHATPKEVLLLPILFDNSTIAVLETASFASLPEREKVLVHSVTESLGIMINNVIASVRTDTLLEEIKTSEERSSGIIDGSIDAIITINQDGIIQSFNLAGENMFGYSAADVIGENVKMLMPSPYRNEHDSYLANYRDTGEKKIIGIGREVFARRKDGSLFPMDLSISEIDLQGQKLFGGIIRDITARREAEESLQQANADITARQEAEENLQQANVELEEFAYRTSHDLRSPIVSSIRLLDIANKSMTKQDHETAKKSLSHAQASLKKLDALLNDILALTAAKSKSEDKQVVDIALMVDDALLKLDHMEGFERLKIQKTINFEGTLSVKQSRLNMILENLISNAIKYQDVSKESSYMTISAYNEDSHFVLEVKDNGLGIPKNQQDKLFSMFKRFHPRIAFGSGLGLYLMKKSADVLEGKVSYQGHEHGSIFRLSVPL